MANYTASDLLLWQYATSAEFAIQSIENGGRFSLIRTKMPFQLVGDTMPVCINDGSVGLSGNRNWPRDPTPRCTVEKTNKDGYYIGTSCPVNATGCIFSYASPFHIESKNEIEGMKRRFLTGIGYRVEKKGDPVDGSYDCDYSHGDPFSHTDYLELDFLNYTPKT